MTLAGSVARRYLTLTPFFRNVHSDLKVNHAWTKDAEMPTTGGSTSKAIVLGMFSPANESCDTNDALNKPVFTNTANKYNDYSCSELYKQLKASSSPIGLGEARVFFNVEPSFPITVLVGLGNECYGYNKFEHRDEAKEAVRLAAGAGCRAVQNLGVTRVYVESFGITEAAAEGAALALWIYQDFKSKQKRKKVPYLGLYDDCDWTAWQIGLEKAGAQNLARQLMEAPSNVTTPLLFALTSLDELCKTGISAEVRVENWIAENRMDAFLSVSKGSHEQPIFLELQYNGCDPCTPPIVMAGKGITYDAGGLCLKRNHQELLMMKGDMAGAAMVVATMRAIASMGLPINVRGLIPLCENMPGAGAFKPGDIVRSMNGKNILVEDTDAEGLLILADALSYSQKYRPNFILDIATLTKQAQSLMGNASSVVHTNDDSLWTSIKAASIHTGDRVWRLPLWDAYHSEVESTNLGADLVNVPLSRQGYTSASAAFLSNFVCYNKWLHLDTYPVMYENGDTPYLREGMSGRPTRTLVEMFAMMACRPSEC